MSDAYIKINKPTGTPYNNINPPGKIPYDDPMVLYDAGNIAFDGGDGTSYIKVSKPTGSPYTNIPKPIS